MMRKRSQGAAGLTLLALATSLAAAGEELLLFDGPYTHTKRTSGFSYPKIQNQPDDWTFPVNYADGTVQSRYIVKSVSSDTTISYQWCLFQGGSNHTCLTCAKFNSPGTYFAEKVVKKLWANFTVDWSRNFGRFMLVVKDATGAPVSNGSGFGGKWIGSPDFDLYFPFEVHTTVVVIPAGSTFSGWENYVPGMPGIAGRIFSMTKSQRIKACAGRGQLGLAWNAAEKLAKSGDADEAEDGRRVAAFLAEYVRSSREGALRVKGQDPVGAVKQMAELAEKIRPRGEVKEILKEAKAWNREPATRQARAAEGVFLQMKKTYDLLKKKLGKNKATDPKSVRLYGRDIAVVTSYARVLKQRYPETRAARRALAICAKLGIEVP